MDLVILHWISSECIVSKHIDSFCFIMVDLAGKRSVSFYWHSTVFML